MGAPRKQCPPRARRVARKRVGEMALIFLSAGVSVCVYVCVCKKVSEKRVGGESENARGFE